MIFIYLNCLLLGSTFNAQPPPFGSAETPPARPLAPAAAWRTALGHSRRPALFAATVKGFPKPIKNGENFVSHPKEEHWKLVEPD